MRTNYLRRSIGRWSLAALMVNTIFGASIFGLPSLLVAHLGKLSPQAYFVAAVGVGAIAACLAEVSSQFRATGGPYLYARAAFGKFAGIQVGWLLWVSRIAASSAVANLFISYLSQFFPQVAIPATRALVLILLIGFLATVNYRGVTGGTRLNNFFTIAKLILLVLFAGGGLTAMLLLPAVRTTPETVSPTVSDWFEAVILMVYAYGGFEAAVIASGEAHDPRTDVPMALLIAFVTATFLFVSVQYVVVHLLPHAGDTTTPAADVAKRLVGPLGATFVTGAILVSLYGYLGANMLHAPRLTFAMGEQGDFPRFLAAIHPRFQSPHVSIVAFALLLMVFSIAGSFRWNVILAAASRLLVYGCISAALPVLRRKHPSADAFRLPYGLLFVALALVFTTVLVTKIHLGEVAVIGATFVVALFTWFCTRQKLESPKAVASGRVGGTH
jgi:amino acid transporter